MSAPLLQHQAPLVSDARGKSASTCLIMGTLFKGPLLHGENLRYTQRNPTRSVGRRPISASFCLIQLNFQMLRPLYCGCFLAEFCFLLTLTSVVEYAASPEDAQASTVEANTLCYCSSCVSDTGFVAFTSISCRQRKGVYPDHAGTSK